MQGTGERPDDPDEAAYGDTPDTAVSLARGLLWVVAVVAGVFTFMIVSDGIEMQAYGGNEAARWIAFAEVAAFVLSVVGLRGLYRHGFDRYELLAAVGPVAMLVALFGFGLYQSRDNNDRLVWDYCAYGSVSVAQFARCVEDVTPGQVIYADTPASRFALGGGDCGVGSGPYCDEAAKRREVEAEVRNEDERFR